MTTTETEEPCSRRCGYVSSGLELWLHERHEHFRCPDCGREPIGVSSVSHERDCPRIRPGYVYPGPIPAEYEGPDDEVWADEGTDDHDEMGPF
jgi:predicted RNA-binding Zn-ribbon protein involved in translation (DUF1610 family)